MACALHAINQLRLSNLLQNLGFVPMANRAPCRERMKNWINTLWRLASPAHRIYLVGGMLIVATLVAAALIVWERRQQVILSTERELANLSVALAEQTARSLQAVDLVLRETQSRVSAAGIDTPEQFKRLMASDDIHRFLADRLATLPQADGIALLDAGGVMINGGRTWPVPPRLDFSDRDHFRHFRDNDDPGVFVGAPVRNRLRDAWNFFLARGIRGPHGEFLGVVGSSINLRYFEEFYRAISLQDGGSASIIQSDGTLLVRYPHLEEMIGQKLSLQSGWYSVAAHGGIYHSPGYVDGVARIISVRALRDYPLTISVAASQDAVLADWRHFALIVATGAVCIVVCFGGLFHILATRSRMMERQTTALAEAASALQDSEERFRAFAVTSSDWFWETDSNHRFSYISDSVSNFGLTAGDVLGRSRMEIAAASGNRSVNWDDHLAVLERHQPFRDFAYTWKGRTGREGVASVSGDPRFDEAGRFLGYRGTGRDITELKATEARLHQTQEDLNRAQRLAKVGSDIWDLRTGRITWSDEAYRIFGVDPATFVPSTEALLGLVVPEDRPALLARVKEILRGKCPPPCEFSIRRPDGKFRRIYSEAELVVDENGMPLRWVGMRQDITARQRVERKLREAKEAAEAANLAKSQFLANMSHELRTPLNAINGFSEALELGYAGALGARPLEYAGLIHQSGEHLLHVINDILDLAKVDAGKFELHEERTVDPRQLVDDSIKLMKSQAVAAAISLSAEVEEALPPILADPTRLKQILLNLISNAVKFTDAGGAVMVMARRGADGGIVFEVRDTGPGMSAEEVEIALQPFGQIETAHSRRYQGTGLGLPLAQRLAELHGGSLCVDSEKGRGTRVLITLPRCRVMDASPGAIAALSAEPVSLDRHRV
jgi:PAS domain S-box-containing protein